MKRGQDLQRASNQAQGKFLEGLHRGNNKSDQRKAHKRSSQNGRCRYCSANTFHSLKCPPLPPLDGKPCHPEQSIVGTAVALPGGELIAEQHGDAEEEEAAAASAEGQNSSESLKQERCRLSQQQK